LIVRVSDINFSRTGSAAIAKALLEKELKAGGRGELTVTFERARYYYSQLRTWLALSLDSLGTYKAVSWSINQRTSQIRVAFANETALSGFKSVVANLGIPSDAVVLGLEPEEQLYQARLDTVVRPVRGGLVVYTHQWHYDGAGTAWNGPCTLTGIFLQGTWPEFLTAAHCVNFAEAVEKSFKIVRDAIRHAKAPIRARLTTFTESGRSLRTLRQMETTSTSQVRAASTQ
jgi:hypothetical protein